MGIFRARSLPKYLARLLLLVAAIFFGGSILLVIAFRWLPVPLTSFTIQAQVRAALDAKNHPAFLMTWKNDQALPKNLKAAVLAAEDQRYFEHGGFDFEALQRAYFYNQRHLRVRGGSTISQQLAKNLFLWSGRSYFRKGLEAYFTLLLETLWSKQRILEVYLNVVEFGDQTYGAEAASQRYFGKPAAKLGSYEAALLAAVLPAPRRWLVAHPSQFVQSRAARIQAQMPSISIPTAAEN